jgi:hypothetical protein
MDLNHLSLSKFEDEGPGNAKYAWQKFKLRRLYNNATTVARLTTDYASHEFLTLLRLWFTTSSLSCKICSSFAQQPGLAQKGWNYPSVSKGIIPLWEYYLKEIRGKTKMTKIVDSRSLERPWIFSKFPCSFTEVWILHDNS